MEWIYLIAGLIAGGVIGYVIVNLSAKAKILEAEKGIEQATSKALGEKSELETEKRVLENQLETLTSEKNMLLNKLDSETKNRVESEKKVVAQEGAFQNLKEKLDNERKQIEELELKFQKEFENIANKILKQNSFEFNQTSNKNLNDILNPLKEKLGKFERQVQETYCNTGFIYPQYRYQEARYDYSPYAGAQEIYSVNHSPYPARCLTSSKAYPRA